MENSKYFDDIQKCPFHSQQRDSDENTDSRENANTGDWDDERDETGTDPDRYDRDNLEEEGGNDNSGGAGSSGSAATNS